MNMVQESVAALQSTWAGVVVVDESGRISMVNREAEHITGLAESDVAGRRMCDVLPLGCDTRHEMCLWRWAVDGSERRQRPREVSTRLANRQIDVLAGARGSYDHAGQAGAVVTFIDLSHQHTHEQRGSRALADVLHDLRSPLSAISLAAQFLGNDAHAVSAQRFTQLVSIIQRNASTMVDDINTLLERPDAIADAPTLTSVQSVPLGTIAVRALSTVQPLLDGKEQTVRVEIDDTLLVRADERRIEQVIINLLANANKYSIEGDDIVLRAAPAGDAYVRVEVEDHGPGIPDDLHAHVFERFYRAPEARGAQGVGLGLAIVRDIIMEHGGDVGVEGNVPRGTRFWFTLLRAEP